MRNTPATCITQIKSLYKNRMHADALRACANAVSEWPHDLDILNLYGELLTQLSRPVEAGSLFPRCTCTFTGPGRCPESPCSGFAYYRADRLRQSSHANRRLSLAPDIAEIHANLGNIHAAQGDMGAAEKSFQRALEIEPRILRCAIESR